MASRIQGITLEIGGDTTKLSSALKDVNANIKSTQTQLKDVEKLLKLDPSNVTLLAQKQKLLTQEISATKEKGRLHLGRGYLQADGSRYRGKQSGCACRGAGTCQ